MTTVSGCAGRPRAGGILVSMAAVAVAWGLLAGGGDAAYGKDKDKDIDPNLIALKDCPSEPGCPALILLDQTELDNSSVQAKLSRRQMIKLFTEEGIAKYADVEAASIVGSDEVKNLGGRTILPDGTILPLKQENVFVKTALKRGSRRVRTKTAKFPGIVPGAIIDYSYDLVSSRASNYTEYTWEIQRNLPVLESVLVVKSGEMNFATMPGGLQRIEVTRSSPYKYMTTLRAVNVPSIPKEPMGPPADALRARLYLYLPELQPSWMGEMAGRIAGYTGAFIGDAGATHAKVAEIVGEKDTPLERVKKIYQFVQQFGTEEKRAEQTDEAQLQDPNNVDEVLKRGFGNEAERTLLFVAMARESGLESGILLIAPRDSTILNTATPDEDQFDAFAAAVKTGGANWTFYDPAVRHCPFGMISANKEGGVPNAMLIVPQKGAGTAFTSTISHTIIGRHQPTNYSVATIPFSASSKNVLTREALVTLKPDGAAEVEATDRGTGLADLDQRDRYEMLDDEKRKEAMTDWLQKTVPRAQLVSASFDDIGSFEKPAAIQYKFTVPEVASGVADKIVLTPSIFEAGRPTPFSADNRLTAVQFPHTQKTVQSIKFEIPAGYTIAEMPRPGNLREGPFGLVTNYSKDGDRLVFYRRLEIDTATWGAGGYAQLKSFFEKVQEADRQVVVLVKGGGS